jgi:plastocyanin
LIDDYDSVYFYWFDDGGQRPRTTTTHSRRWEIEGEVTNVKEATVHGEKRQVAALKSAQGQQLVVDLGSKNALQDLEITKGDRLTVAGPAARIGGKRILLAQHLKMNGQRREIRRDGQEVRGEIERLRRLTARGDGSARMVANILTDDDNRVMVDLGPSDRLQKLELREGDRITVRGPVARIDDGRVMMANRVEAGGQQVAVDRGPSDSGQRQQVSDRVTRRRGQSDEGSREGTRGASSDSDQAATKRDAITGVVKSVREPDIAGRTHMVVSLQADDDRRLVVDLGPRQRLGSSDIQQGDRLTVCGPATDVGDQRVVVARQIKQDGRWRDIERQHQQVRGEIDQLREANVEHNEAGGSCLVATIVTDDDRRVTVDLGPRQGVRNLDPREGDRIVAKGPMGRVADQWFLVANRVTIDDQETSIERDDSARNSRPELDRESRGQGPQESGRRDRPDSERNRSAGDSERDRRTGEAERTRQNSESQRNQPAGGQTSAAADGETITVVAENMAFQPASIRAEPGARIHLRLRNQGDRRHNIEFELPNGEKSLENDVSPGETASLEVRVPEEPGRYRFYCPVGDHREQGMTGVLVVR